jgi:hypothetical protein
VSTSATALATNAAMARYAAESDDKGAPCANRGRRRAFYVAQVRRRPLLDSPAMSKKVRGPVRANRRPGARPASATTARRRPSQLEAAEVIAEDIVEERPAEAAAALETVARTVPTRAGVRTKPGSLLAAKAATEYVYVAQDMRRILFVAALLFGAMIILWLVLVVMRVIPLPFY